MNFGHIVAAIGKDALRVVKFVPLPPPFNVIATAASQVALQALDNDKPGEQKKDAVVSEVLNHSAITGIATVDQPTKLQAVQDIVEAIVTIFKAFAILFPQGTETKTT